MNPVKGIDGQTRLVGVLGWPVEHTFSPAMHNAAFAALGLDWIYLPLPVPPERLESALPGLAALGFRGANVTVPHKQAVSRYVDDLSEGALAIGAVNTIVVREDGRTVGYNTDWRGFLASLEETGFDSAGRRALVLGAGGAARAVVYGLARIGAQVVILNRTLARAKALLEHLAPAVPSSALAVRSLDASALAEEAARADLLVQTTPVGMWPHEGESLWPDSLPWPSHLVACDLVYRPRETELLRRARQAGAGVVDGLGMLVHQGGLALQLWTGQAAPLHVMRAACVQALEVG